MKKYEIIQQCYEFIQTFLSEDTSMFDSPDKIKSIISEMVYSKHITINGLSEDETIDTLYCYVSDCGIITELLLELDKNTDIDKIVLIGLNKAIFKKNLKEETIINDLTEELVFHSMYLVADKYKRNFGRDTPYLILDCGSYIIELSNEYRPTIVIRRITKDLVKDNSLEYRILSALLRTPIINDSDKDLCIRDVLSLKEEFNVKKRIKDILISELTNIYARKK